MKEEQIKSFLEAINAPEISEETDINEYAAGLVSSWKKAGQNDTEYIKSLQSELYGKLHGSYKNSFKKLLGLSDADIKELDKDGLFDLAQNKLKEITQSSPDKATVQELQKQLAEAQEALNGTAEEKAALAEKLERLEPELRQAIKTEYETQTALRQAFTGIDGFLLEPTEAIAAFLPKLSGYSLEIQDGVLRGVNQETGKLLYDGNAPADVSEMAKAWAIKRASPQRPQNSETPQAKTEANEKALSFLHPSAKKRLGLG